MRKAVRKVAKKRPARKKPAKKAPTAAEKKVKELQAEVKKLKGYISGIGRIVNRTKAKPAKKAKKGPARRRVVRKKK